MSVKGGRQSSWIIPLLGLWALDALGADGTTSVPVLSGDSHPQSRAVGVLGPDAAGRLSVGSGFTFSANALARARGATVRMQQGGSGAFVSPRGLVVTSQKAAAACLRDVQQQPGRTETDASVLSFVAHKPADELPCSGLVVEQSEWLADVSREVEAWVHKAGDRAEPTTVAQAIRTIQMRCEQNSKALCWVQARESEPRFDLFRTRVFRDVRLVFLPEASMVSFGGQDAQFRFPQYSFDLAFLRVYEDGQPLSTSAFLPVSTQAASLNAHTVLLGYPAASERDVTEAEQSFLKEIVYPFLSTSLRQQIQVLRAYIRPEAAQRDAALRELAALEYWHTAIDAAWQGLTRLPAAANAPATERVVPLANAKLGALAAPSPSDGTGLAQAYERAELYRQHAVIARRFGPTWSALAMRARDWVRFEEAQSRIAAGGRVLPSDRDLVRQAKQRLVQPLTLDVELETKKLAWGLRMLRAQLGAEHVVMRGILDGRSPEESAAFLIQNTKINDPQVVRSWLTSPRQFAPTLSDPLLKAVRRLEDIAQKLRTRHAQHRFAREEAHSSESSPATSGTNPLPHWSTGRFQGVREDRKLTPWRSQLGGVYLRHKRSAGEFPYALSPRWEQALPRLNFMLPYNLQSTHDADLAQSGAPLVDESGHILAIMIDVNEAQIGNRFVDHGEPGRIISLHAAAIVHILREVYEARELLRELVPQ